MHLFKDNIDLVRTSTTSTSLYDVPFRPTPMLESYDHLRSGEAHLLDIV